MREIVENKLDQIARIWNNFIWEYDFCKRKVKFTQEVQTNYFGDILGYFQDTFDIIFDHRQSKTYSERFSNQISLLQSIYVQQDFIEELLLIFKCKVSKGDLKLDANYSINRDIRNELVGHPIRRLNGNGALISSCLFAYNSSSAKVAYIRYHKDTNFKFESIAFEVSEIVQRHIDFLNTYFDKIINRLKRILSKFIREVENVESLIERKSFNDILHISTLFYESIFGSDYIYDKESLLKIYEKRIDHPRYQNLIDKFYFDLKTGLMETKNYVKDLFEPKNEIDPAEYEKPLFTTSFLEPVKVKTETKETYHYELGKLATKRNHHDFSFFSGLIKQKFMENDIITEEFDHMESNLHDEIEYYCSHRLICKVLGED